MVAQETILGARLKERRRLLQGAALKGEVCALDSTCEIMEIHESMVYKYFLKCKLIE